MNDPSPETNQFGKVQQLRQLIESNTQVLKKAAGVGVMVAALLGLPSCDIQAGPPPTPTPITEPTRQPVFEPTAIPKPTPTIEGPTIKGETLAIGGNTLELKTFNGANVAKQIDAQNRGWRIVTNDKGNVQTFLGEANGIQVGVLAQGPEGHTWDSNNSLWKKDNQVNIPNMIIPGAWDEKRQMAGPTVFAEMAFLYKDSQNNYHIGVLYSPQTMQKLPPGVENQIQKLDNGYGLFTGEPKNFTLKDGQSIVRTKEGNLRLINADGGYSQMITSWDKVKTPKQIYQVGSFSGPIESIPSLLYPPESIVGKDLGEIKLTKEGLVVALNSDANPTQIAVATLDKETNQWVWEKYKTLSLTPSSLTPEQAKKYLGDTLNQQFTGSVFKDEGSGATIFLTDKVKEQIGQGKIDWQNLVAYFLNQKRAFDGIFINSSNFVVLSTSSSGQPIVYVLNDVSFDILNGGVPVEDYKRGLATVLIQTKSGPVKQKMSYNYDKGYIPGIYQWSPERNQFLQHDGYQIKGRYEIGENGGGWTKTPPSEHQYFLPPEKQIPYIVNLLRNEKSAYNEPYQFDSYVVTKRGPQIIIPVGGTNGFTQQQAEKIRDWIDWVFNNSSHTKEIQTVADVRFFVKDYEGLKKLNYIAGPNNFNNGAVWGIETIDYPQNMSRVDILITFFHEMARIYNMTLKNTGQDYEKIVYETEESLWNDFIGFLEPAEQRYVKDALAFHKSLVPQFKK